MHNGLPDACLTLRPSDGSLIYIERGQRGYCTSNWNTSDSDKNRSIADHFNQKRGVTKAQEEAMLNGSMFGWNVPGANPENYENTPQPDVNAGYAIIKRETIGKIEIVLGESISGASTYVTWRRTPSHEHDGHPSYYWGHYFVSKVRAEDDFNTRVREEQLQSTDNVIERFKSPKCNDRER